MATTFTRRVLYGFKELLKWIKDLISNHNEDYRAHSIGFSHSIDMHNREILNVSGLEFAPIYSENYGGYIDFHYNGYIPTSDTSVQSGKRYYKRLGSGTDADPYNYVWLRDLQVGEAIQANTYEHADYTSRIIETTSGVLTVYGKITYYSYPTTSTFEDHDLVYKKYVDDRFANLSASSVGAIGFPNYANAGGINVHYVYSSSPQTVTSNMYLLIVAAGRDPDNNGDRKDSFTIVVNGHVVLAGWLQSTHSWYQSGGGATVIPLKKGTTWYMQTNPDFIEALRWQYIPME